MVKQIQCQVTDAAKEVLLTWQKKHQFSRQDTALEDLLIKFGKHETEMRKEEANHIDELITED